MVDVAKLKYSVSVVGDDGTQYNIKNTVSFDASKWRTALGAYGFSECVAAQDNSGVWGDYHINGPEWIS